MADLQDRGAWPYLDQLTNDYGQVVKLSGMLGVRTRSEYRQSNY